MEELFGSHCSAANLQKNCSPSNVANSECKLYDTESNADAGTCMQIQAFTVNAMYRKRHRCQHLHDTESTTEPSTYMLQKAVQIRVTGGIIGDLAEWLKEVINQLLQVFHLLAQSINVTENKQLSNLMLTAPYHDPLDVS